VPLWSEPVVAALPDGVPVEPVTAPVVEPEPLVAPLVVPLVLPLTEPVVAPVEGVVPDVEPVVPDVVPVAEPLVDDVPLGAAPLVDDVPELPVVVLPTVVPLCVPVTVPDAAICCCTDCVNSCEPVTAVQVLPPPLAICADKAFTETPHTFAAILTGICAVTGMFARSTLRSTARLLRMFSRLTLMSGSEVWAFAENALAASPRVRATALA
jgi:hypothetical protein